MKPPIIAALMAIINSTDEDHYFSFLGRPAG